MMHKLKLHYNMLHAKTISEILSYFTCYLMMRSILNLFGVKRVNSTDEWHKSNVDIAALNSEIRLDITDDDRLSTLENKYNECINNIKQKQIDSNTQKILNYRTHNKQKFLKKLFVSQNQQVITQNLKYKNKFLPKNIAHRSYYKDLMQDSKLIKNKSIMHQIQSLHSDLTMMIQ